jgi:hypothetical protein
MFVSPYDRDVPQNDLLVAQLLAMQGHTGGRLAQLTPRTLAHRIPVLNKEASSGT